MARKSRPQPRRTSHRSLCMENLENRRLLATITEGVTYVDGLAIQGVTVQGTDRPDIVEVRMSGSRMVVSVDDGHSTRSWSGDPKVVFFHGRGGDDEFVNRTHVTSYAWGDAGNDTLVGGQQSSWPGDQLVGGGGHDVLVGGAGSDYLFGDRRGWGDDPNSGSSGNDILYGGSGVNSMYGGPGNDQLYGGNDVDYIHGNEGNDLIWGYGGNDWLSGESGHDVIWGGFGNDLIWGDDGRDVLYGEQGNDTLDGGYDSYRDSLFGDYYYRTNIDGGDTFVIHRSARGSSWNDAIYSFNPSEGDRIDSRVH